ncbi:flagellar biosynthesis anti-sigma factor FlgM [Rhodocyclus tenuis]|uniref:Negative regulator of flagellin synthesis n=1 Tax=Rhodocyclus gracilis TaxID=2929842 RepID=A0ABX0WHD4_9RHOO|nr:flagellar biosynthesis anti-sigma factor FlgM [Rhodocyclus gracilis]
MKIERPVTPSTGFNTSETRVRTTPAAGSAPTPASAEATAVRLSGFAAQIKSSQGEAPVDTAKVAQIRQAISEGRFSINADAIAGRLVDSARELVQAGRRN